MPITTKQRNFDPDLLNSAIPGQSLTANPGQFPYEKPPLTADPERALDSLVEGIQEPSASKTIAMLLDAGVTSETIAGSLVIQGIAEGAFSPDVAELLKPLLIGYILQEGEKNGVEQMDVTNEIPQETMTEQEGLDLMQKVSPDKYENNVQFGDEFLEDFEQDEEEEMFYEEGMNMEMPDRDIESGGFINRGSEV